VGVAAANLSPPSLPSPIDGEGVNRVTGGVPGTRLSGFGSFPFDSPWGGVYPSFCSDNLEGMEGSVAFVWARQKTLS
jgi:hypothetical protein